MGHKGVKAYSEWVVQVLKDILFILDVVNVLRLNDIELLHRLNREFVLWVIFEPSDLNITESTYQVLAKE